MLFGLPVVAASFSSLHAQEESISSRQNGAASESQSTAASATSETAEAIPASDEAPLQLSDLVASIYHAYPTVQQARLERARAGGMIVGAYGAYDTKLQGYSLSEPTGFYRNYRQGIGVARQTWWGGYLSAGYRIGRGSFQPWYKERETNEGGEFKLGFAVPLLQGRAIDEQRLAVFQARLTAEAAEPAVQQAILSTYREAAGVYWDWVAAGARLAAQRELLDLAEQRARKFEVGVAAGKFAEIDLIFNRQLIAERKTKTLEGEQKLRAASFKLSLYLRDELNEPIVPDDAWLPELFPEIQELPQGDFQADLRDALARRPEPRALQIELRQVHLERQLAYNNLKPRLDFLTEASQDVGVPASSSNDKGQFEVMVGLQGEVPIQRRKAKGKIQETSAKMSQIEQKLLLQSNKIGMELQTAYNALTLSAQIIEQSEVGLITALDSLRRYQYAFDRGKADLIYLNMLETKVNEAEIKLLEAQRNWFVALSEMQAALGLDPLEQAVEIASLPPSTKPGPGHLPQLPETPAETLEQDWQRHLAIPPAAKP